MDLGAYANIEILDELVKANGISVPRLRGYRLMSAETPITDKDMARLIREEALSECEMWCCSNFGRWSYHLFSGSTDKLRHKYMEYDGSTPTVIHWERIHGKRRKTLKYLIKKRSERVLQQYAMFNKYAGKENILYIHARIGGDNWDYYGGPQLAKQPWFIEKVDDCFDNTYCDIYAKINMDK